MNEFALIFGAGKTGRGFAAHLAFLGGYHIILVDKNKRLVSQLKEANQYDIQVLGNEKADCKITLAGAYHIEDFSWHEKFTEASIVFTSVFGNNLEELGQQMAIA